MVDTTHTANASESPHWHALRVEAVCEKLGANPDLGLSPDEVAHRQVIYGGNVLHERAPRPLFLTFLDQFNDFMILILIVAALVSGIVGDIKDALAIVVIVALNALIGMTQAIRAERALAALKKMAANHAIVLRDGEAVQIPAVELVPGDTVLLEAGNVIPADLRLIGVSQLKIDESSLTGEALTIDKHTDVLIDPDVPLGDRVNMAFKGSAASYGRGTGIVVASGMNTELGKIAALLDADHPLKTPLQQRLATFGKHLGLAVLAICFLIFVAGLLRGEKAVLMFLTAVSLAVAAIPEALPAVVTISLAMGARKMVRQHALIRRLPAVETLGSVSTICSDKTGTLTQNRMEVREVFADGTSLRQWDAPPTHAPWTCFFTALAVSNDAHLPSKHPGNNSSASATGDPTEIALYIVAQSAGYDKVMLAAKMPRAFEQPFDSDRKRMTTFHQTPDGFIAYTKGAPETVLPQCRTALTAQGEITLDRAAATSAAERMASEGLRVLAIAQRQWHQLPDQGQGVDQIESDMTLLGLVGMLDPPRPEAQDAVRLCLSAGITPVMITGDHALTAGFIARQLGIASEHDEVVTGAQLAMMDDDALSRRVATIRVYARVDPAQKIRIVQALQSTGQFVAMTGDGVNDAPALKRADIGIAMGKSGTDVAREASSLILLDDNFATIVTAVREGRRIFDNIRKFIKYTMTSNSAEILTIFLAPLLGLPIPLLPIHILWINLVTDGLPGLALAAEPAEKGIMQRSPRPPQESIFAHGMWQHIIWCGLAMAGVSLFAQYWAIHSGSAHWQTMVFTVLTLAQMCHVLAIRSERASLLTQGLGSNLPLLGAVLLTFALQMATIYVPWLNPIFNTVPLTAFELGFCLLLSPVVLLLVEGEKWMRRKGWIYRDNFARNVSSH